MPYDKTDFPAVFGPFAILKPLSAEGDRPVYLVALHGSKKPWVLKMVLLQGRPGPDFQAVKSDVKVLARMRSSHLVEVLDLADIEGNAGFLMEFVNGKSLMEIHRRVVEAKATLPPGFGAILAYDVLGAMVYFYGFEGIRQVHGNLSPRTLLLDYAGNVKVAGYRPGFHALPSANAQVAIDLKLLSDLLGTLPIQAIPRQLAQLLQNLQNSNVPGDAAILRVKDFLAGFLPPVEERLALAAWLKQIFPGEEAKTIEENLQLVEAGTKLLVQASAKPGHRLGYPVVGEEVGEYRILNVLGEGGMGRVYEAQHLKTANRFALKVLHPNRRTPGIEERFRREAQAIQQIVSDHVVRIDHFGATNDGKYLCLAMELLEGTSLDRLIAQEGPLPPQRALKIGLQLCQALSIAHKSGVIHRDLKPGNVMLTSRVDNPDFVKILDFGLARFDNEAVALTRPGDLIGTFQYMAPEQAQGKPATPKVDIYGVGEILYEMLTAKTPHESADDILVKKATTDAIPVARYRSDLPASIANMIMKALARDPEARQATMKDLEDEITALLEPPQKQRSLPRRARPWPFVFAGVALLALAGVGARWVSHQRGKQNSKPPIQSIQVQNVKPTVVQAKPEPDSPHPDTPIPSDRMAPIAMVPRPSPNRLAGADTRVSKGKTDEDPTEALLRSAEKSFESGDRITAIQLARQALKAGGGVRSHLALAKYYQSTHLYREALGHYQKAIELDPENNIAAMGIKVVEKQLQQNL